MDPGSQRDPSDPDTIKLATFQYNNILVTLGDRAILLAFQLRDFARAGHLHWQQALEHTPGVEERVGYITTHTLRPTDIESKSKSDWAIDESALRGSLKEFMSLTAEVDKLLKPQYTPESSMVDSGSSDPLNPRMFPEKEGAPPGHIPERALPEVGESSRAAGKRPIPRGGTADQAAEQI